MADAKRERKWLTPNRRAEGYAEERKKKIHMRGDKEGEQLSDYDKGLRSGYLLCQSDHAGAFIYHEAINSGKSKKEASRLSKIIGKGKKKNG